MRVLSALLVVVALAFSAYGSDVEDDTVLLFSYFVDNGQDGLHFAWSEDGLRWEALRDGQPFMAPGLGSKSLVRDPCVALGPDGLYHMVWTVGWWKRGIGYAHSKDLVHWSEPRHLEVMAHEPATRNTWAPEIFYDEQDEEWLIFWASTIPGHFPQTAGSSETDLNHRMYYTKTTDFETFAPTKLFYDHGFNVIDASVYRANGKYLMFLKDEALDPPEKNIRMAWADDPEGPWSDASEPISGKYWAEGPTAIQRGDTWFLYFDLYRKGRFEVLTSSDLKAWTSRGDALEMPQGIRHGTVFEVPRAVLHGMR